MLHLADRTYVHFHYAHGFATQTLAYMLDSLVRVSRRVDENHFVRIVIMHIVYPTQYFTPPTACHDIQASGTKQEQVAKPSGASLLPQSRTR